MNWHVSIICLLAACAGSPVTACHAAKLYHEALGLQCVKSEFKVTHSDAECAPECALLCDRTTDCQAFSVADGPCQLFVFNRCSKYVRDCSCTRRAQVFVKQQPGLPPGALCPVGFADDFCGTKYKLYGNITDWFDAKAMIDALPGLTIMADVTDQTEMAHLKGIASRDSLLRVVLGGWQLPGSAEPAGGWIWASCNSSISSELWTPGQPSNHLNKENYASFGTFMSGLNDEPHIRTTASGVLVECVSPFSP